MINTINSTESIKGYLTENADILKKYFKECYNNLKEPNYSELCRKYLVDGTTKEGVSFDSIFAERSELTDFLRDGYKLWMIS